MMKNMFIGVSALTLALLSGCATTDAPPTAKKTDAQLAGFSATTGSRIPRATTDRVVRSTERDLADEPVRSISNQVGIK
jgi:outer membrane biogenesis lipoprotein LolB